LFQEIAVAFWPHRVYIPYIDAVTCLNVWHNAIRTVAIQMFRA